jgi:hypothetical protein
MTLNLNRESEEDIMKKALSIRLAIAVIAFCLPLIPNPASAQQEKGKEAVTTEQKPVVAYRIEFNVREIEDGKRLNSRNYMMVVEEGSYARIRVGNRIPIIGGEKGLQYNDVGMNIDCHPRGREDRVSLEISVELSSVAAQEQPPAATTNPVFRQQRSNILSVVTLGKPTVVASMDDVVSNRRYEIEVTATKVK